MLKKKQRILIKIAINALSATTGGGVTYLRHLVPKLAELGNGDVFHLLVSKEHFDEVFNDIVLPPNVKVYRMSTKTIINRFFAEQIFLPVHILQNKINVLLCPANVVPFLAPCSIIVWIQNVFPFIVNRNNMTLRDRLLDILTSLSVRRASVVILSSKNSFALAIASKVDQRKCRQIYLGVNKNTDPPKYPKTAILSVSNIYLHKDFKTLISAYSLLPSDLQRAHPLIIVGHPIGEEGKKQLLEMNDIIAKNDFLVGITIETSADSKKLSELYSNAILFVMPSLIESFSFPVFEAMAAGLPVIAARATCLPEVVGEAGLIYEAASPTDLSDKIRMLLSNASLIDEFALKGRERAASFSWEKTAKETLNCIYELCGGKIENQNID